MDLRAWVADSHRDLHDRLLGSVIRLVPPERWTERPGGDGSSIAWLLLHMARHQDLALTTVVRGRPPLYLEHAAALGLGDRPPTAGLTEQEDTSVSAALPPDALLAYVEAVFAASRRWIAKLNLMAMEIVPATARRLSGKALLPTEEFGWLYSMWSGRTVSWFVQWPVLGHGNAHVGEAIAVRNRLGLSPF